MSQTIGDGKSTARESLWPIAKTVKSCFSSCPTPTILWTATRKSQEEPFGLSYVIAELVGGMGITNVSCLPSSKRLVKEMKQMLVHLMLELYGVDPKILSDEPLVRRALDEFPQRIDMEKVSPVHLYQIET